MRKILLLGAVVIAVLSTAAPASAADACRPMLMPVIELKQLARGFGFIQGGGFHSGLDLTAPYGSPVRAAAGGVVVFAGSYFGYGNMIDIRHEAGVVTRYAHLSAFARGLRIGSTVATGALIGNIGTSGHAHGPHLHFEVRLNDVAVDPKPFLALAACPLAPSEPLEEARAPDRATRADPGPQVIVFADDLPDRHPR